MPFSSPDTDMYYKLYSTCSRDDTSIGLLRVSENMHGSGVTSRPEYSLGVLLLWLTMGNAAWQASKSAARPRFMLYMLF